MIVVTHDIEELLDICDEISSVRTFIYSKQNNWVRIAIKLESNSLNLIYEQPFEKKSFEHTVYIHSRKHDKQYIRNLIFKHCALLIV